MTAAAITTKNQLTLPKTVRQKLGVGAGDSVIFEPLADGAFRISARVERDWRALSGSLKHLAGKRAPTIEQIDDAIGAHLAAEDQRISRRK